MGEYDANDNVIGDEDALALCLLQCDVATLRVLKGLSPYAALCPLAPCMHRIYVLSLTVSRASRGDATNYT